MLYLFLPGKRIYDISLFDHSFCYFLNVIFRRFSYAFFDAFFFNAVYTLSLLLLYRFIIVSGWLLYGLDCANLTLSTSSLTLCITYIYDFFPLFLFTLFTPFLLLFSFPMNCQVFYCIFYVLVTVFMPFSSPFFLSNESVRPFFTHFLRTFYAFYAFSSPFFLSNELSSFFSMIACRQWGLSHLQHTYSGATVFWLPSRRKCHICELFPLFGSAPVSHPQMSHLQRIRKGVKSVKST